MAERLELNFRTNEGKNFRINVEDPEEDLTSAEVMPAMQTIIDTNVFNVDGGIAEAVSAELVTIQREPIPLT
ncbi:MAG: DUF2922 domain-containing protein [Clostridia bacterium]|nr:DUF2922 domain-containing protein [Clostridia bacterium]